MKNEQKKSKIVLIDDHPIVRLGLSQIIGLEENLEVCGEASNANDAIALISRTKPDLVLVDISLDDDMSGLELIKAVKNRFSGIKTLVLSMHNDIMYVERAIRAGARGYVAKKNAYDTIIDAINKVLSGELYLSEAMSKQLIHKTYVKENNQHDNISDNLSNREFEIFQMIGNGLETTEIAQKTGISINTVQTYKRHIKEKLGIKNHSDLVRRAVLFYQLKGYNNNDTHNNGETSPQA
ncbi:MAG TPA: response regulator transcription factor [Spirochaetota bacterium]|nr:response regulator transcription factor [Spirochaetota bacterium]HPI91042.1 response regulator transcription factor [Spirochaetota bacterium]HPR47293.1 response regulator transcription factor [Spirochaetota bacterium]